MNKRLWTILVSVLLVVTLSVCLFACNDSTSSTPSEASSFKLRDGNANSVVTKSIQVSTNASFAVTSTEAIEGKVFDANVKFINSKTGESVAYSTVMVDSKNFKINAPKAGYAAGWYELELLDSRLSFSQYDGASKLSILVVEDSDVNAEINSNVVYLSAGSAAIYGFTTSGSFNTFKFNANIANQTIKMGDTILVQGEDGKYAAYNIWGVEATADDGIYTVSYTTPAYDEVYDKFVAASSATLNDGTVAYANATEAAGIIAEQLSAAGFDLGPVHIEANKVDDVVVLTITVEVNDILGDKDGANSLGLELTFGIESKITADTNINIGSLLKKDDNTISIKADFANKLTFNAAIKDGVQVNSTSEIDAIIAKIKSVIQKDNENDVAIPVFNWVVPIGNGVADVSFQVFAVMDFAFSGKLGVEAEATSGFEAAIAYNPATPEVAPKVAITETQGLDFESVLVSFDGNATIHLGVYAEIKFELLAGVISIGVGAEVGNYNRIYGSVITENLLEIKKDVDKAALVEAYYGFYFEGGIYYDVKFLYNVAGIVSGAKSLVDGRQYVNLYDAGSPYRVDYIEAGLPMTLTTKPKAVDVKGTYVNLVTGEPVDEVSALPAEALKTIKLVNDDQYVAIDENGNIYLKDAATSLTNYQVEVSIGGAKTSITVNSKGATQTNVGSLVNVTGIDSSATKVIVKYADGEEIKPIYTAGQTTAQFTPEKAGYITVYVNGNVFATYVVA